MKPTVTWVLIADGARARIVANEGPGRGISSVPGYEFEATTKPSREIDADKPGRTFDSAGQGRHAKEPPTDAHRYEEHKFVRMLAEKLREAFVQRAFDRLVIIAPPVALGDLRKLLDKEVAKAVHAEIPKDLTKASDSQIVEQLGEVLAV